VYFILLFFINSQTEKAGARDPRDDRRAPWNAWRDLHASDARHRKSPRERWGPFSWAAHSGDGGQSNNLPPDTRPNDTSNPCSERSRTCC